MLTEREKVKSRRVEMTIRGESLIFDQRRAIYWGNQKTLIISDLHIGKTAHFRKNGIAISNSVIHNDLGRLAELLSMYDVEKLLILGDLSHSAINREWDVWLEFLNGYNNIGVSLVPGNHDILNANEYHRGKIEVLDDVYYSDPFCFTHDPGNIEVMEMFSFSGHLHPVVRLRGIARQGITLPCFHISKENIVLPAFSAFTGGFKIRPKKGESVLAISSKGIYVLNDE